LAIVVSLAIFLTFSFGSASAKLTIDLRLALNLGMYLMRVFLTTLWLLLCGFYSVAVAQTSAWPTKPLTLVVSYPPGGGADAMARLIAPKLSETLGQPVVVENKPGASGQIAASNVAKAPADGYTLLLDASSFSVNPALYPKISYDSEKAFRAIGVLALFPNVLLVNAQFPAKSVTELIALAKAKKDAVAFASSGNGSAQHLAGALFESSAKVDMVHVPYKGGGLALNDVIGGQVPVFFGNLASSLQHIQSGRLRALAVTSSKRSSSLPDVPTLAETGVADAEVYEWNPVLVPAGTPDAIVTKLALALQKALESADVKARILQLGGDPFSGSSDAAKSFIQQQMQLWSRVVKAKGIVLE
jgi:tripartite-type tricarboxylate transporter receptor subunit TctC